MTIFAALIFILIVLAFVYLRTKSDGKYEIKLTDIIMGILPVAIWLLLSGNISELQVGDLRVKLNEEFKRNIVQETSLKDNLLADGENYFSIGVDCEYAIEPDIKNNSPYPGGSSYTYVIIQKDCEDDKYGHAHPKFWAILSFKDLSEGFLDPRSKLNGKLFLLWAKERDFKSLSESLPSFVSVQNAVTFKTDKLTALEKMEELNVEFLPVIDEDKTFLGVVTKSKLTTSFLVNIGRDLRKNQ